MKTLANLAEEEGFDFARYDAEVCRYAGEQGRIIISKDEDFLHLANRPEATIRVLWVRLGKL